MRLLLLPLLFLSFYSIAQFPISPNKFDEQGKRIGNWTLLFDSLWKETHNPDSTFYYRLIRFEKGNPSGKVRDFYRNGFRQWDGYLVSLNPDVFDNGENNYYYENGRLNFKRTMVNQQLNGPSLEYSITGKLIGKGEYKNGLADGLYTYYSEDGLVIFEIMFRNGKKNGSSIAYHPNGKVKRKSFYKDDLLEGLMEDFDENGQVVERSYYKSGKANGPDDTYFTSGKIKEKSFYENHEANGPYTEFYESGKTKRAGSYKNSSKNGAWVFYHPYGTVESKGNYVLGKRDGVWEYFFESGKLSSKGSYQNDLYEGEWILYYENDEVKERTAYHLGEPDGNFISFYETGIAKSTGHYKAGKKDNVWKYYFENKNLKTEGIFENSNRTGLWKYYFETGELDAIENYEAGQLNGEVINYYVNGKVKDKGQYVLGKKEGEITEYYDTGITKSSAFYHDGLNHGMKKNFYANGNIKALSEYKNGIEDGRFETYYENGNPFLIGKVVDGKPAGLFTAYHKNGNKATEKELLGGGLNGSIIFYDSITQRVAKRGNMLNNNKNGQWITYNAKGKEESVEYFIHGEKETQRFAQDSIQQLNDMGMYDAAMKAIPWMERITKRDIIDKVAFALPISMKAKIYNGSGDYPQYLKYANEYLAVIKKVGPGSPSHKTAVHNVATAYHDLDRYEEALKMYDQAIEMERSKGLVTSYWSSVINKVYCLYDAKREQEAIALIEDELTKSKKKYVDSSAGWYIRHEAADYYYNRPSNYVRASELFISLLKDMQKFGETKNDYRYTSYQRLGKMMYENDKAISSIAYYDSALVYAEKNNLTQYPAYGELLVNQYGNYSYLSDTSAQSKKKVVVSKIKKQLDHTSKFHLLAKLYSTLQDFNYDEGSYNTAVAYGERAEAACLKAKKENTVLFALILQTQAWSIYYSDHKNNALSEEKFLKAIELRKQLYGAKRFSYYGEKVRLGSFYYNIDQYQKAINNINESIPLLIENHNEQRLAEANKFLGNAYYAIAKYTQALACYKIALAYYSQNTGQYPYDLKSIFGSMAKCYALLKVNYSEAKNYAEKSYQIAVELNGEKNSAALSRLDDLAWIHELFSAYSEAQKYYQQEANAYKELSGAESDNYINMVVQLAKVSREKNEPLKGIELLLPYLKPLEAKPVSHTYYKVLSELADSYSALKNYAQEEIYRKKIIVLAKQLYGEDSSFAYNLRMLGELYRNMNRLDEAEPILTKALNASRLTTYNNMSTSWLFFYSLGDLKSSLDKNKEAEELFLEAVSVTEKDTINSPSEYQVSVQNLAGFYTKMGRYKDAEIALTKISAFVFRLEGKSFYYARLRESLVRCYDDQEQYDKSKTEAMQLVKYAEEELGSSHWLTLSLHNDLGNAAIGQADYATAKKEYQICIDGYKRIEKPTDNEVSSLATIYSNLADVNINLGLIDEAEKNLVECDRLRKLSSAPLSIITQNITRRIWTKVHEEKGDHVKAEKTWVEVMANLLHYTHENFYFMSDEEKALFWKSQGGNFRNFQSYGARRAKENPLITGSMYNVQLATKAILLSSSNKIRKRILSSGDTLMVNMYYRWQHQRDQLAQLYASPKNTATYQASIDSVKKKINHLEKELNIAAEDQVEDKGGSAVDWKQLQALLKPDEAAIEIIRFKYAKRVVKDSIIYAALILTDETKVAPALVILPDGKFLEGRALKFYKNSIAAHLDDPASYRAYWAAIEPIVKNKSRIYLSLDGVYNSINLNSLKSPSGEFLVDTKNLTLLSNTKELLAIKGKKIRGFNRANATLLGFPTYFLGKEKVVKKLNGTRDFDASQLSTENQSGIADLPGTKIEIEKIQDLLASHQWNVKTLLDETATENAVKEISQPKLLHIATHGYFTTEVSETSTDPMMRAGLLFTGAANFLQDKVNLTGNNGILTAYEASNLNLDNTDLVVLSACETGKGEVQNGEGVYGLQRAFQTAGAQAIIMSLWKVDDTATQELMTAFYQNWMEGKTKAEAFHLAQLQLKKKYDHPYYWGAFVMMGN